MEISFNSRRSLLALGLLVAVIRPVTSHADPLPVASLTPVISDLVRNVGGEHVEVFNVIPPDTDAHAFTPTVSDIRALTEASVIFVNGLGYESFLGDLERSVGDDPVFITVGDAVEPLAVEPSHDHSDHSDHHHHHHGGPDATVDPHWWHSVGNARLATNAIRDALIEADPDHADSYRDNASAYQDRLEKLAREIKLTVARLPRDRRVLVTSHDALGYFARDHGFTIYAVAGLSSDGQPSSKKIRALIEQIRAEKIPAIFPENTENPKILDEITRETDATIGGALYADGLGTEKADTYEKMMRYNAQTIVDALQ
ncbi:MAG: metal ABC transporter substrate-binding protein [Chthoniobacterales bacterium]